MKTLCLLLCLASGLTARSQAIYETLLALSGTATASDGRWTNSGALALMGGVPESMWADQNQLAGTYTTVGEGTFQMIACSGTITNIRWLCTQTDASAKAYKILLYRPTGTNIGTVVYKTDSLTAATGTNSVDVSWDVQEGDNFGWWAEDIDTRLALRNTTAAYEGRTRYAAGEAAVGSGYVPGTGTQTLMNMAAYGVGPAIAYSGDSILCGFPNFGPFLSCYEDQGLASNSVPWVTQQREGQIASYQDFVRPNYGVEWVNLTAMTYVTNSLARLFWLHVGVNDIGNAMNWATFETNLLSIRSKFGTAKPFFVAEILPTANLDDAEALTVRTWNTNLLNWSTTNNATLVRLHDYFGKNRAATGQLDDLADAYSLDGVHLSTAGIAAYARHVKTNLTSLVK